MSNNPIADMKFSQMLLKAGKKDPAIPFTPIKVHIVLMLYQVYSELGPDMGASTDLLIQDTDISDLECVVSCDQLAEEGTVEILPENSFRLTPIGVERADVVYEFYEQCYF